MHFGQEELNKEFSSNNQGSFVSKSRSDCLNKKDSVNANQRSDIKYCTHLLNPFPNKPWFLCVYSTSLLKTLGKRRNCSLRAISPFPTVFSTR